MVLVANPGDFVPPGEATGTVLPRVISCFARGFIAKVDLEQLVMGQICGTLR